MLYLFRNALFKKIKGCSEKECAKNLNLLYYCAADSIKKSATFKNDFMMLSLLSQDLVVLEGHHKSCYREYTQKVKNL